MTFFFFFLDFDDKTGAILDDRVAGSELWSAAESAALDVLALSNDAADNCFSSAASAITPGTFYTHNPTAYHAAQSSDSLKATERALIMYAVTCFCLGNTVKMGGL